jgi:hypothetical protein
MHVVSPFSTAVVDDTRAPSAPHAVCMTGLQRAFPFIGENVRSALASLYSCETLDCPLDRTATLFGVRPANDSWSAVRVHLPPLADEAVQKTCARSQALTLASLQTSTA